MNRFSISARSAWGMGVALVLATACNPAVRKDTGSEPAARVQSALPAPVVAATTAATPSALVPASAAPVVAAPVAPQPVARALGSTLTVKRFVVTTGIKDREPLTDSAPLVADGSAIFAFAELANPTGGTENVRITFERKGGAERVGNVTLPIPGQVPRHRTWATTRFIRAAGVWDAVLWNESGTEIGRTSFEVGAAS